MIERIANLERRRHRTAVHLHIPATEHRRKITTRENSTPSLKPLQDLVPVEDSFLPFLQAMAMAQPQRQYSEHLKTMSSQSISFLQREPENHLHQNPPVAVMKNTRPNTCRQAKYLKPPVTHSFR